MSGTIGIFLGLAAVAFLRPQVPAAAVLIILLCILLVAGIGGMIGALRRRA